MGGGLTCAHPKSSSLPIEVYLSQMDAQERWLLTRASSTGRMLFPVNWGMNQLAGKADEWAAEELLPQWGCSRYGPELSASPTTLWDKSCSGNIWELYPFKRCKKENRRQEGAYKVTTRDICMYVRWICGYVLICLPVCVSLHGCDFPLYKLTSFHESSADKQSCMHVALWHSRQFSSSSTSVDSDASFLISVLPESPYDTSSDKGQCDWLQCGQWDSLLFHLQQLHVDYFRIVFWFLRLGSWAQSSLAHPLVACLSYWAKGLLPCPSSCTVFLTELIHFRTWWNVSLSASSFSDSSCGLRGVSSHLAWPFAFSYSGFSASLTGVGAGESWSRVSGLWGGGGGCLMLMPLGLEISPLVKPECNCLLPSTWPLPGGVFQKTQGKEARLLMTESWTLCDNISTTFCLL